MLGICGLGKLMIKLDLAFGAGVWHRHEIRTFVLILVDYVHMLLFNYPPTASHFQ